MPQLSEALQSDQGRVEARGWKPGKWDTSSHESCECTGTRRLRTTLPLTGGEQIQNSPFRKLFPRLDWIVEGADSDSSLSTSGHERLETQEGSSDTPSRLPHLFVVSGEGETDLLVELPAPVRGENDQVRRTHGILCRKLNTAVVQTIGKLS